LEQSSTTNKQTTGIIDGHQSIIVESKEAREPRKSHSPFLVQTLIFNILYFYDSRLILYMLIIIL